MGTEILKSFGTLQSELEQAKNSLKGVDENIKRLIGRDPSEIPQQRIGGLKRSNVQNEDARAARQQQQQHQQQQHQQQQRGGMPGNRRVYNHENDEPPNKRRGSVFNRLSDRVPERPSHYEDEFDAKSHRQMISKVIVTPKEVPSRQEALEAQNKDEKSKARNRRMFGALLGTLQKFRQEETKLKSKEEKRAQVEKKIEEIEIREKAEIKKERKELFWNRKKKQAEIKMIELKMIRMKEYAQWEEIQKPRMNFIQTKAKPHVHYLPRKLNEANKAALALSKTEIEKLIDLKRQEVFDDLQQIEERMKRNFEPRKAKESKENNNEPEDEDEAMQDESIVEMKLDEVIEEESVSVIEEAQMNTSESVVVAEKDAGVVEQEVEQEIKCPIEAEVERMEESTTPEPPLLPDAN